MKLAVQVPIAVHIQDNVIARRELVDQNVILVWKVFMAFHRTDANVSTFLFPLFIVLNFIINNLY